MKTFDGGIPHPPDTEPAPPPQAGCCGPVTDRLSLVEKMSKMISQAHSGLAAIYDSLANDLVREENKEAFRDAAKNQRQLAEDSKLVTTLDVPEEEQPVEGACAYCGEAPGESPMVDISDGAISAGRYHVGCVGPAFAKGK